MSFAPGSTLDSVIGVSRTSASRAPRTHRARIAGAAGCVAAACVLALAGCGVSPLGGGAGEAGSADGANSAGAGESGARETATPLLAGFGSSPTSVLQPLGTADSSPKTQRPSEPAQLAVAGVRVGNHEGFDRVVVDLSGDGDPGWFVDYASTPVRGTIGRAMAVSGQAFLNINIDGTVSPAVAGLEPQVAVVQPGSTGNIVDVVNAGVSEGRSQIVVGLRSEAAYSVQVLEDPKRLVIDIVQG